MTRLFISLCLLMIVSLTTVQAQRDYYEIRKYTISGTDQEKRLDNYFKNAYLPALHRAGVKDVGVFKPVLTDEANAGKYVYVFIPLKSLDQLHRLPETLAKDKQYLAEGKDYIDASYQNAPYVRYETTVLRAFVDAPKYKRSKVEGPKAERIYELRSYEGHTEKIYQNKVKMFNDGNEIGIFDRLGFNAVFYGEVIAGATQPNLMYMTTFKNKADRDAHWDAFRTDSEWNKLKVEPEYQNNVSKNVTLLLYPADYSDI